MHKMGKQGYDEKAKSGDWQEDQRKRQQNKSSDSLRHKLGNGGSMARHTHLPRQPPSFSHTHSPTHARRVTYICCVLEGLRKLPSFFLGRQHVLNPDDRVQSAHGLVWWGWTVRNKMVALGFLVRPPFACRACPLRWPRHGCSESWAHSSLLARG